MKAASSGFAWRLRSTRSRCSRGRDRRGNEKAAEGLRKQVAEWNERFNAHRFLLAESVAATLMLSHDKILAGVPAE